MHPHLFRPIVGGIISRPHPPGETMHFTCGLWQLEPTEIVSNLQQNVYDAGFISEKVDKGGKPHIQEILGVT